MKNLESVQTSLLGSFAKRVNTTSRCQLNAVNSSILLLIQLLSDYELGPEMNMASIYNNRSTIKARDSDPRLT